MKSLSKMLEALTPPPPVGEESLLGEEVVLDFIALPVFGSPDPDALASAFALQEIFLLKGIESKIYVEKSISHPNNQVFVNMLDLSLFSFDEIPEGCAYTIVDSPYRKLEGRKCLIHIDHHKEGASEARYVDINIGAGSCSTILAQYLMTAFENEEDSEWKELLTKVLGKVAIGLAYGIYTDTNSFLRANTKDLAALSYLRSFYDSDALTALATVNFSSQTMEVIKKALASNEVKSTFSYAGIGHISAEHRDSLAIAADFLLNRAGVTNVLVYAIVEDEADYINGCFRTSDSGMDTDKFMKSFVRAGDGGGRKEAGGFQEPLGFFQDSKNKDKVWEVVQQTIEEKVKRKISLASGGKNQE